MLRAIFKTKAHRDHLLTADQYRSGSHKLVDNFKLIRICAALFVLAGHIGWVFYGKIPTDNLFVSFLTNMAFLSVICFFSISGFLLTHSLKQRQDLIKFTMARGLRLFPPLIVVTMIIALVLGPLVTKVPLVDYVFSSQLWLYISTTAFGAPTMLLPGVFETVPSKTEVNISIWTLRYSYLCYGSIAAIFALGLLHKFRLFIWAIPCLLVYLAITYMTNWVQTIAPIHHLLFAGTSFISGILFYIYGKKIPFHGGIALFFIMLSIMLNGSAISELMIIMTTSYSVIWFGLRPFSVLKQYNKFDDYSYGLYLSHWPIAQAFMDTGLIHSYEMLILCVLPFALLSAFVIRKGIENPCGNLLEPLTDWGRTKSHLLQKKISTIQLNISTNPLGLPSGMQQNELFQNNRPSDIEILRQHGLLR